MAVTDNVTRGEFAAFAREMRQLALSTPLASASVGRGRLRFYDGSELLIEDGNLTVSGTATVTGELTGGGTFSWTGPVTLTGTTTMTGTTDLNGPVNINGATTQNGALHITGDTDVTGTLTVANPGSIVAGNITIDTGGIHGPTVQLDAPDLFNVQSGLTIFSGDIQVNGNSNTTGSKSFLIDHPSKPGMKLMHGSTESPVSGTEYWGASRFDENGECVVSLPDYFEALNKPTNRNVLVSPVGRPYAIGADTIFDGRFAAYGAPGREFQWLVKAERCGADFPVESSAIPAATAE